MGPRTEPCGQGDKIPRIGDKVQRTEGKGAEDGFEHKATNWLGPDREQGVRNTRMMSVLRVGWGRRLARGRGIYTQEKHQWQEVQRVVDWERQARWLRERGLVWVKARWSLHRGPRKVGGAPSPQDQKTLGNDF